MRSVGTHQRKQCCSSSSYERVLLTKTKPEDVCLVCDCFVLYSHIGKGNNLLCVLVSLVLLVLCCVVLCCVVFWRQSNWQEVSDTGLLGFVCSLKHLNLKDGEGVQVIRNPGSCGYLHWRVGSPVCTFPSQWRWGWETGLAAAQFMFVQGLLW